MNDLIRRQDAINVIDDMFMEDERYKVWLKLDINNLPSAPMDAVPIEFIEEFIQGIIQTRDKQIQDISKWRHFDDNIVVLVALLDSWKEEQEKQE